MEFERKEQRRLLEEARKRHDAEGDEAKIDH